MRKTEIYIKARNNQELDNREYLNKEINEIVQAQFHYFWYSVNLKYNLESCAFSNLCEKQLKKIKTQILVFQANNSYIFNKKDEVNLFNTVIIHLLLNKEYSHITKLNKI